LVIKINFDRQLTDENENKNDRVVLTPERADKFTDESYSQRRTQDRRNVCIPSGVIHAV